ncbi:pentatricopeptide repeat-containing protein At3g09040, mitochondrial-like [Selaginella moellendorffii]|uniref:pentatricopeptide repeat-containing protein At3g09040, mitochondrial-like n=1 Tax=Selaginella moellendorffii TaxID=88036 RepID=UPI000D1CE0FA|nr:pentatricopeptide repeat-containing protein At3g09040, mitochondrial-like [Selaginella moellendorffii]|eukprot:XP_024545070.1 pentatricopeptide repeat-containing protein At3g09040, mitochondrial-like [Selaginella moellendorffii]
MAGMDSNIFVANTLLSMYAKCGAMEDARRVFDAIESHTVVSWNALVLGYARNLDGTRALESFSRMTDARFDPDARTYNAVLKALAISLEKELGGDGDVAKKKRHFLEKTLAVHARLKEAGHERDVFVASSLVDLYAKCGSLIDASNVFERMARHDAVSWTALILGYVQGGEFQKALDLFSRMVGEGFQPDARAFVAALKACASLASSEEEGSIFFGLEEQGSGSSERKDERRIVCLEIGVAIHAELEKLGLVESDLFVASSLVDMYAKCGCMEDSTRVFERMKQRDVVTWNSLLMGFAQGGEAKIVLSLFHRLQQQGGGVEPDTRTYIAVFKAFANLAARNYKDGDLRSWCLDQGRAIHSQMSPLSSSSTEIFLWSTLVDMYSKCGNLINAREIFDSVSKPDLVLWNSIILGCALNDENELALELLDRLQQQNLSPDDGTFVAALKACGNSAALETGRTIHTQVLNAGLESKPLVATSLVDFYAKSGTMDEARDVFDSMDPAKRSSVTWNSLLSGYSRVGDHNQVFQVFESMKAGASSRACEIVNGVTFLCLLNACSHAGLVDRAKDYFESMRGDYGIAATEDHYACMVDLFGRSNQMEAAVSMAESLPLEGGSGLKRAVWMTVLSCCERMGNKEIGKLAFETIVKLNPDDAPAYVLLANTCL